MKKQMLERQFNIVAGLQEVDEFAGLLRMVIDDIADIRTEMKHGETRAGLVGYLEEVLGKLNRIRNNDRREEFDSDCV
jgi:hypothetical protein